jgi:hypothetical protein
MRLPRISKETKYELPLVFIQEVRNKLVQYYLKI